MNTNIVSINHNEYESIGDEDFEDEMDILFEIWRRNPELMKGIPCYDLGGM